MDTSPDHPAVVVSVITPCLNGLPYLEQCIRSVVAQTFTQWELIVIDDGSTDGSAETIRQWAARDARIRLFGTTGRTGASRARNLGIRHARGRYVAFLDCDDWWQPEKLAVQLAAMAAQDAGFCCSVYNVVSADGEIVRIQEVRPPLTARRYQSKRFVIGCATVLIDRQKLDGIHFAEHLRNAEDFLLWCQLLVRCEALHVRAICTDTPVANYRVHTGGKSSSKLLHARAHWHIYRRELRLSLLQASTRLAGYVFNGLRDRLAPPRR